MEEVNIKYDASNRNKISKISHTSLSEIANKKHWIHKLDEFESIEVEKLDIFVEDKKAKEPEYDNLLMEVYLLRDQLKQQKITIEQKN